MLSLVITLICNLVRLAIAKLKYGKRYESSVIERISNRTSVTLFGKGSLKLGRNIELAPYVDIQVHGSGQISIGERTYMNRYCMISCQGQVNIGSNCMFGPGVKIFDNNHRFAKDKGVSSELKIGKVIIGNNCWIASDAVILKGARIGDNSVIGAGCIIDGIVPPNSLVKLSRKLDIESIK